MKFINDTLCKKERERERDSMRVHEPEVERWLRTWSLSQITLTFVFVVPLDGRRQIFTQ